MSKQSTANTKRCRKERSNWYRPILIPNPQKTVTRTAFQGSLAVRHFTPPPTAPCASRHLSLEPTPYEQRGRTDKRCARYVLQQVLLVLAHGGHEGLQVGVPVV